MKKWMFRVACLLAFAFSPAAFMAPPAQAVVATTKVTLTTSAWTDLGVGPILVSSAGRVVYAVSDTTPALVAEGFPIPAGDARTINTASHVWARSLDGISAFIYVSPILASGGGGGGTAGAITPDGSGLVVQKNGTQAQAFRVYNTYTDASNGEWGAFDWTTTPNTLTIAAQANGTGILRPVNLSGYTITFNTWNQPNALIIDQNGNLHAYGATWFHNAIQVGSGATAGANCSAGTVTLATLVVINGVITHC
jgi:hypothetical protein